MAEPESKSVLLAGASGFLGGYVLEALLESPALGRIYAITRRPLGREHPRLANRIVKFEQLSAQLKGLSCQIAICCLGAPRGKTAVQQSFRQVDLDYVVAFAAVAKAAQAQRFIVVSAAGADPESKNPYLRAKGEMEKSVAALGFVGLDILQPGPLLGWRREMRAPEIAATVAMPVINPFLRGAREAYRGIDAQTVAAAMAAATRSGRRGAHRYTYGSLKSLAGRSAS